MADVPTEMVTFLLTDVEGSAKLWDSHPEAMASALARYDTLLRLAVSARGGMVYQAAGDAFCAMFTTAADALAAAQTAQRTLQAEGWGAGLLDSSRGLQVRMALHTGPAAAESSGAFDVVLQYVVRLLAAGRGGQVLLSPASAAAVRPDLPPDVSLRDLGEWWLKDQPAPQHIFQLVTPQPAGPAPRIPTPTRITNLRPPATAFIGREAEVAAVRQLARRREVRLVTLTGPGGTGKTRLSLHVATALLDYFMHGVFFVALAAIQDPALVPSTIAGALGVKETAGESLLERLKEYLRDQHLLLVLDNFEQVTAAAPLVEDLLAATRRLVILVTSRAPLHLAAEHEYLVPPMGLPDPRHIRTLDALAKYPAVALFTVRAQAVQPDFALTLENASAVTEICARLDGLPLAIELAAARSNLLRPVQMLAHLTATPGGGSLHLLTGGSPDLPLRQQTLRGAIDWSYDLLPPGARTMFARLAVFVGSCTLHAAEVVCNAHKPARTTLLRAPLRVLPIAALDGLEVLLENSLLRQMAGINGEPRFGMLETIQEYALEQLNSSGEVPTLRDRHAGYYLALAESAEPELRGTQQVKWLARLEDEHDNIRAALRWALESGDLETAVRLGRAMWRFWYARGHLSEGRRWLEVGLAAGRATLPAALRARALRGAGILARQQGDYAKARALLDESLTLWREQDDTRGIATSLNSLALLILDQGDYAGAQTYLEQSLVLERELGGQQGIARALSNLGSVALRQGEYVIAKRFFKEALGLLRDVGDQWTLAHAFSNLAAAEHYLAHYEQAQVLFKQSLAMRRELGDRPGIVECLEGLAMGCGAQGQPEWAAQFFGAAEALREQIGKPVLLTGRPEYGRLVDLARSQMDPAAWQAAWAAGRAMSLEQVVALAIAGRVKPLDQAITYVLEDLPDD